MRSRNVNFVRTILIAGILMTAGRADGANTPSVKYVIENFEPAQKKDVEYETPNPDEYGKCKVEVERKGKSSGWVVFGPNGQVLRRFVDSDGDNVVDQWRYYNHGLEVYRDIDTNANNKIDQSRWLNLGGSRWGIDKNEDGRIDSWKVISAAEVSREAVRALVSGDARLLEPLLITADEIRTLKIQADLSKKLLESVESPRTQLRDVLAKPTTVNKTTKWMRFDGATPCTIPADEGKAAGDLTVYENAMAIVETDGKPGLVQIGEMIKVGNVWKLSQIPRPLDGDMQVSVGGILMEPVIGSGVTAPTGDLSPEMQKLLTELQELDKDAPAATAGPAALGRYNKQRADILEKLVEAAPNDKEREQWMRQMVDGMAAAVQAGAYPDGLERLKALEEKLRRSDAAAATVAYAAYRRLLAEYTAQLQQASDEDRAEVQTWWLKELEDFTKKFPDAEDTPEAMLQLAISHEFAGKIDDARSWYGRVAKDHGKSDAAGRAAGALRRLDLEGKTLRLSGPALDGGTIDAAGYRDKALLVIFWSTWCKPCTEDLPQIRALYEKHRSDGFEVLGVNLDMTSKPIQPYVEEHQVPWRHIHQPGGLESEPGKAFGIISLPTMFLVDREGKVVSRGISVDELKKQLPDLLK